MCQVCNQVKLLSSKKQALDLIAAELKKGRDPTHFKKLLDDILETPEPEVDPDLDELWENKRGPRT